MSKRASLVRTSNGKSNMFPAAEEGDGAKKASFKVKVATFFKNQDKSTTGEF